MQSNDVKLESLTNNNRCVDNFFGASYQYDMLVGYQVSSIVFAVIPSSRQSIVKINNTVVEYTLTVIRDNAF